MNAWLKMCVMPSASFVSSFKLALPQQNRALFAIGNRLSKLIGPPSRVGSECCFMHTCMHACVCVRPNLKQVSVISPVEALAQREPIIHTVTLFAVALWSFHPSLSLPSSRTLGHKFNSPPKGSQIRSIKWFWAVFWKLNVAANRQSNLEEKVTY